MLSLHPNLIVSLIGEWWPELRSQYWRTCCPSNVRNVLQVNFSLNPDVVISMLGASWKGEAFFLRGGLMLHLGLIIWLIWLMSKV